MTYFEAQTYYEEVLAYFDVVLTYFEEGPAYFDVLTYFVEVLAYFEKFLAYFGGPSPFLTFNAKKMLVPHFHDPFYHNTKLAHLSHSLSLIVVNSFRADI
ncbi:unnamed protein product [Linum trigynum]|uniref:Uncharacterized protein n=1 Tax=Linum trigynum TaxID=586398 RepID=A0AAV2FQV5_9ROSI